jgi:pfkB family carbohydrate kinase
VFPVTRLEDGQIVDTNGAGDAFAGGFLGALVAGKSLDDAVLAGHKLGGMCVQLVSTLETHLVLRFPERYCRSDRSTLGRRWPYCRYGIHQGWKHSLLFTALKPLPALNSGHWKVVTSYNTCIILPH